MDYVNIQPVVPNNSPYCTSFYSKCWMCLEQNTLIGYLQMFAFFRTIIHWTTMNWISEHHQVLRLHTLVHISYLNPDMLRGKAARKIVTTGVTKGWFRPSQRADWQRNYPKPFNAFQAVTADFNPLVSPISTKYVHMKKYHSIRPYVYTDGSIVFSDKQGYSINNWSIEKPCLPKEREIMLTPSFLWTHWSRKSCKSMSFECISPN